MHLFTSHREFASRLSLQFGDNDQKFWWQTQHSHTLKTCELTCAKNLEAWKQVCVCSDMQQWQWSTVSPCVLTSIARPACVGVLLWSEPVSLCALFPTSCHLHGCCWWIEVCLTSCWFGVSAVYTPLSVCLCPVPLSLWGPEFLYENSEGVCPERNRQIEFQMLWLGSWICLSMFCTDSSLSPPLLCSNNQLCVCVRWAAGVRDSHLTTWPGCCLRIGWLLSLKIQLMPAFGLSLSPFPADSSLCVTYLVNCDSVCKVAYLYLELLFKELLAWVCFVPKLPVILIKLVLL